MGMGRKLYREGVFQELLSKQNWTKVGHVNVPIATNSFFKKSSQNSTNLIGWKYLRFYMEW